MCESSQQPWRPILRYAIAAAVLISAGDALGDKVVRPGVKPGSRSAATSVKIKVLKDATPGGGNPNGAEIIPPQGWNVRRAPGVQRTWIIDGNQIQPGQRIPVTVHNPGGSERGRVVGFDFTDANGKISWSGVCSDPVSFRVVEGGVDGSSYLGMAIPPGEWGYFYQVWNPAGFADATTTARIAMPPEAAPHDFTVIPKTFEFRPIPGFDLADLEIPAALPDTQEYYDWEAYMDPDDVLNVPGVPLTWSFDAASSSAVMTFLPNSRQAGMGAEMTGSIVGYLSAQPPTFPDEENVSMEFLGDYDCPKDFAPVPAPEPSSALLAAVVGVALAARVRRA